MRGWRHIKSALAVGLMIGLPSSGTLAIDLKDPEDIIRANRMIQCSTVDGEAVRYMWQGMMYMRRQGEPDRRLFKVTGTNVRQCSALDGGKKGTGYRMTSREIMLYQDPKTGEVLDMWENPVTGESVKVIHVINDPVNGRPSFPFDDEGKPAARWYGDDQDGRWFLNVTVPLFYHNELSGEYQPYVGGVYHNTEMFNFSGDLADFDKRGATTVPATVGWVRMGQYLPWMRMQGREGLLYVHAYGLKLLGGFDDLPPVLKDFITNEQPKYKVPPPADDARPNETSWTYFKKQVEGGRLPRGGVN